MAQAIIRSVIDFKRDPWPRVSDTAKDLVRRMLEPDPKKRLSAAEVLGMCLLFTSVLPKSITYEILICRASLDTKCKEGSKCFPRRDCESKAQTVFCYEQAQETSSTGK